MPGMTPLPAAGHHTARLNDAMWNYLTTPFLLTYPGARARDISPQEDGQTWDQPRVTFPCHHHPRRRAGLLLRRRSAPPPGLRRRRQRRRPGRALHRRLPDLRPAGPPHPPPGLPPQPRPHPGRSLAAITLDIYDITVSPG
jgi:hypothetical protein